MIAEVEKLSIKGAAELISLGMTFPTVMLSIAVVVKWGPSAIAAWKARLRSSEQWFILGVFLGFLGSIFDNCYWFIPWSASYIGHDSADSLFGAGVYFNIFFRQGLGVSAAYCHLRAGAEADKRLVKLTNFLVAVSYVAGLAYCLVLVLYTAL